MIEARIFFLPLGVNEIRIWYDGWRERESAAGENPVGCVLVQFFLTWIFSHFFSPLSFSLALWCTFFSPRATLSLSRALNTARRRRWMKHGVWIEDVKEKQERSVIFKVEKGWCSPHESEWKKIERRKKCCVHSPDIIPPSNYAVCTFFFSVVVPFSLALAVCIFMLFWSTMNALYTATFFSPYRMDITTLFSTPFLARESRECVYMCIQQLAFPCHVHYITVQLLWVCKRKWARNINIVIVNLREMDR